MKTSVDGFISVFIILPVFAVIMYSIYYVAKNVSYSLFYEDMVGETITETVKKECLQ